MTKIKICGLSRIQDIEAVNEILPDYIGFVFADSRRKIDAQKAAELKKFLNPKILAVGVFVNASVNEIVNLCEEHIIDMIQLHGDENRSYIEQLKSEIENPIINAVRVQNQQQIIDAQMFPCEYILLDTFQKENYGGSGKVFDHKLIPKLYKPFFLAGGLNADNIIDAMAYHPYCLDVSSGAETGGVKDREKIKQIVNMVRSEH